MLLGDLGGWVSDRGTIRDRDELAERHINVDVVTSHVGGGGGMV